MKRTKLLRKTGFLLLLTLLISTESWAAPYTATTSGTWSAASTWAGGIAPGYNIISDDITINSGVTVTMDNNVSISGALSSLTVVGSLTSGSYDLTINSLGTLSGTGTIAIDGITMGTGAVNSFSGSATVNTYTTSMASLQLAGSTVVNQSLNLEAGTLSLLSSSTLSVADNASIVLSGGLLSTGSGTITFGNNYNVNYQSAVSTGIELTGVSLNNVTVNTVGMVSLGADATINGTLTLTSGTLNLNGNSLALSGNVAASGSGSLQSSSSSNLTINGSSGIAGTLNFTGNSSLNNLIVNVGSGHQAQIGGTLDVTGALLLTSGSLSFNSSTLTLSGSINGSGNLSGSATSNLIVTGSGNISGNLNFASGSQSLDNLTIDIGSGNSVSLGSNLTVGGALILSNGSVLGLGSDTLILNGTLSGSGSFSTNSSTGLVLNISGGSTGVTTSDTIGTLSVNTTASGSVSLGSSTTVSSDLNLQTGTLVLNGNDLTISGNLTTGSGNISSTSSSNITISGSGSPSGIISFAAGGNTVNNFTLDIGSGNHAQIGGSLNVMGALQLDSSTLSFLNSTLTLSGSLSGSGYLAGSSTSDLVLNGSGMAGSLNFASGSQSLNNFTINVGSGNSLNLGSSLTVGGALSLSNGSVLRVGDSLTLNGSFSGSGSFTTSSSSALILNISGGSTNINTSDTIGTLSVNTTASGSVSLDNSIIIGDLNLESGTLVLNGNDLTISGNLTAGTGNVSSTSSSNITISGSGSPSGVLTFATGGSTVNNFTINIGTGNHVQIGGSLDVMGALQLDSSTLSFLNSTLTLSGSLSGSGYLAGSSTSDLVLNGSGLAGSLNFASGSQSLDNFTVNVGSGNWVGLSSDLTVGGALTLSNGSILRLGDSLTLNGSLSGSGSFSTSSSSALILNISGGSTIITTSDTIGILSVNTTASGSVSLGNSIIVSDNLSLQSGTLVLNGNDLNISGNLTAGTGNVSSTSSSNITITGTGSPSGVLTFAAGTNTVNNFKLNVGSGDHLQIGGSLDVMGALQLNSGTLSFLNSTLTLSGSLSGSGNLSGSSTSDLIINSSTGLSGSLNFASGGQSLNNFTVSVGSGHSVTLGSDLAVGGAMSLSNGNVLNIGSDTLTLGGSFIGSGSFSTNSSSGLVLDITGAATISGMDTIGTLIVNAGSASVSLANSINVSSNLNLQSGTLVLNGNNLTISGDLAAGGSGSISSTSSSSVTLNGNGSLSGALTFASGGNSVNNFSIGIGSGNSVSLGSSLGVAGTLGLDGGVINIGSNGLTVQASGSVSGGDSTSYVATSSDSGYLSLNMASSASGWVTFPVGTSLHFSPVALQLNTGSVSSDVHVTANGSVLAQGTTGVALSATQPLVDVTYAVEPVVTSGVNLNMQLIWSAALEVNGFNRDSAYVSHFTNGSWDTYTAASATVQANGMFSVERDNISSFSPFAVFDNNTATGISVVANVQFEVYPNPVASDLIVRNLNSSNTSINMDIMDMDGRVLGSYSLSDGISSISVQNLAAGTYLVKLYNNSGTTIKKITKI